MGTGRDNNLRGSAKHLDTFHYMRPNKSRPLARTLSPNPSETVQKPDPRFAAKTNPSDIEDSDSDNNSEPEYTPVNPRSATGFTTGYRP